MIKPISHWPWRKEQAFKALPQAEKERLCPKHEYTRHETKIDGQVHVTWECRHCGRFLDS